jgi:TonB family protein
VTKAARRQDAVATLAKHEPIPSAKRQKLLAYLVTQDAELWPQVGGQLNNKLMHKQVDSIDELLTATPSGQPAVVLWDVRGCAESTAVLSRLQSHSARFAIVALSDDQSAPACTSAMQHGQIVARVAVPVDADSLTLALASAYEEVNARIALLGDGTAAPAISVPAGPRIPWVTAVSLGLVLIACAGTFVYLRHDDATVKSVPVRGTGTPPQASAPAPVGAEEKVDTLIEKAQRAMRDRHFIEPAEGSALSLYRAALVLDPANGEAGQGLQRLAEILVARAQSALDERQFEVALQALETVRSINPGDNRLPVLDQRIAKLRAELGPAEIQAAINAQNFDRAAQLIDEAAHAKLIGELKLNQLRDDVRRRRTESDIAHLLGLLDARLQQDQLIDPQNDSAAYYLNQARRAGATAPDVQSQYKELIRRLTQAVHGAIDQHRAGDADRYLTAMRSLGAPVTTVAGLQHEVGVARAQQTPEKSDQARFLDLTRSRLALGNVLEPVNDSALFYFNQLRSVDPQNSDLTELAGAIQAKILERVGTALDAADSAQAEGLLQLASGLGSSTGVNALSERLRLAKLGASGAPMEVAEGTLTRIKKLNITYPSSALAKKIEGAVEIAYTVTPKGTVADIKIVDSEPPGIFESAATNAVSRLRYKPVLQSGKAVAVATKILLTFRVAS